MLRNTFTFTKYIWQVCFIHQNGRLLYLFSVNGYGSRLYVIYYYSGILLYIAVLSNPLWMIRNKIMYNELHDNTLKIWTIIQSCNSVKWCKTTVSSNLNFHLVFRASFGCIQTQSHETGSDHYSDAIMSTMASQITSLTIVYSPFI